VSPPPASRPLMGPASLARRTVGEWETRSGVEHENPFMDVVVEGIFRGPSGNEFRIPGFYDGDGTWRVRFSPPESGQWAARVVSRPTDPDLDRDGTFDVVEGDAAGFLRSAPGRGFGFENEAGEPVFILGDTVYDLFGYAASGFDTRSFIERRAKQGFNLLRALMPVSSAVASRRSFAVQEESPASTWLKAETWPWGGSERLPNFGRFNLDYFRTVDRVVQDAEKVGLGLELILEGLGYEFPFNCRNIFVAEWEEEWIRYLIARYDAYTCVYFWTLLNEYERYPDGNWQYPEPLFTDRPAICDRWALRVGRWLKATAQHGHIVAVHNAEIDPPFAQRFKSDPGVIDAIMFQSWGAFGKEDGWLATGIDEEITRSLDGWRGSALLAEYGYERNPALPLAGAAHRYCNPDHTRRGAWRGAFSRLGVVHGFDNTWGPYALLDEDQPGVEYLLHLRQFFTEVIDFARVVPTTSVRVTGEGGLGRTPLVLETEAQEEIAVYLPAGGELEIASPDVSEYVRDWFDPRTAKLSQAVMKPTASGSRFSPPSRQTGQPLDWVLVLRRRTGAKPRNSTSTSAP
jgi:hypothetical protein